MDRMEVVWGGGGSAGLIKVTKNRKKSWLLGARPGTLDFYKMPLIACLSEELLRYRRTLLHGLYSVTSELLQNTFIKRV